MQAHSSCSSWQRCAEVASCAAQRAASRCARALLASSCARASSLAARARLTRCKLRGGQRQRVPIRSSSLYQRTCSTCTIVRARAAAQPFEKPAAARGSQDGVSLTVIPSGNSPLQPPHPLQQKASQARRAARPPCRNAPSQERGGELDGSGVPVRRSEGSIFDNRRPIIIIEQDFSTSAATVVLP